MRRATWLLVFSCILVFYGSVMADTAELQDSLAAQRRCKVDGKSLFSFFMDRYLSADFYNRLTVGDSHIDGPNRIHSAILAVTLFTEARWENDISMALAGFTIFKRADYQPRCIVHAAANSHYSQWLLAQQILKGSIPFWIRNECKQLPACIEQEVQANKLIILDTVKYASQSQKRDQQMTGLKRSIEVAKCITNNLTGTSEISKKYKIGTHFIMPTKVYREVDLQQHSYVFSQTKGCGSFETTQS